MTARHIMILASAGSGKTYALTNQFVRLLAHGARPERIVALTFTRKAAGEFFDEILRKLARAAREADYAAQIGREIGLGSLASADFVRMLREVVEAMHRLRLGTIDGFFARIARAFPFELGLAGEFEVLQEHAARLERRRVLQRMFARNTGGLEAAQQEFVEAFKRATFGTEEKRLGARLDAFLDEHQEVFLAARSTLAWGEPNRIWPEGSEWLVPPTKKLADAVTSLRALLAKRSLPVKQQGRWDAFFAALPEWRPGAPLPKSLSYLLENALDVWADLGRGQAEVTVERSRLALGTEECADLVAIIRAIVGAELRRRLETTRGIHAVLRGYDSVYHEAVRRSGKLTFGDVQRLLMPDLSGETLTRDPGDADGRLFVDYRLDAQFDHWLLDEFQDTSFGQWSVLRNLIDEAVQDPAQGRTFFCVGDVKQAIFTWREGDPRLFHEIFAHYNSAAPGTIVEQHLLKSYRSGPAVIEMVNAVFGRSDVFADLFPGSASDAWNQAWRPHESAQPRLGGQAAWLCAADEGARLALMVRLLHELAPLERGLECAVLTQTNAMATELADYLRREGGIPALAEADLHVGTDNPLGSALLAMVQAAAHPGDTLAWEHVGMTPLQAVLAEENVTTREALTHRVMAQIHADGFGRTMEFWVRRLEGRLAADDAFSRERGRQFLAAAETFDATGSRDPAEFAAFIERYTVRDGDASGAVRVMTIHKAKGLGFDVVILPDLEGQRIDQRRGGLAVQRAPDRTVEWVLDLPPKLFFEHDETLNAHVREAEAEAGYEAMSLLYVAMTRAKRAMYLITKPVGSSESRNYPKLIDAALGESLAPISVGRLGFAEGWSSGDPAWHEKIGTQPVAKSSGESVASLESLSTMRVPRHPGRRPSGERMGVIGADQVFSLTGDAMAEFGTAVHALLAEVEWGGAKELERFAIDWAAKGTPAAVMKEALACLRARETADVWAYPAITAGADGGAEVWRERPFEIVLDGTWVTGVFDRVVVVRDKAGPVRATVFDFKTDRLNDEAALAAAVVRHSGQIALYRRVVAILTGMDEASVSAELVFSGMAQCVGVPSV